MRIWFISDTHEKHHTLTVPEDIDVVIHCGDEANSHEAWRNYGPSQVFFNWFKALPIPRKVFVPGNHSTAFREGLVDTNGCTTLVDQSTCLVTFEKSVYRQQLSVFGSPWTPSMPRGKNWPYTRKRNTMEVVWSDIPACDILITHGPPKGIMDLTYDTLDSKQLVHAGCKSLNNAVRRLRPKIHAFGHMHDEKGCENRGVFKRNGITYINCSVVDLRGRPVGNGEVLEV